MTLGTQQTIQQLIRFAVTGGLATVVHLALYWWLTREFGMWYLVATTLGFLGAFVVGFALQKVWTFQDRSIMRTPKQATLFFVLQICNLLINIVGLRVLVGVAGVSDLLAQVLILGTLALSTYLISRFVIFKRIPLATT